VLDKHVLDKQLLDQIDQASVLDQIDKPHQKVSGQKPGRLKRLLTLLVAVCWAIGLVSCSAAPETTVRKPGMGGKISEVPPPPAIQALSQALEVYQPQVKILSPRDNEVLQDTQVSVRLQVQDLPTFKDEELELGPHLHMLLDNQPYRPIYDAKQPIVLEDLEPGTHTIRVFASRPWHESFKNEGAYAQTTFHLYAKTPENKPDLAKPLLTYSRPQGTYGAEPILLDYYISNVPLHLVAQEDAEDDIPDWLIRCTVNGESFTFDRWQPIYLKGLKPGKNWIQMELLDEQGNPFPNAFNNTVRVVDYQPGGQDSLSKLVRGEIPDTIAPRIVDPNYVPPAPEPEPEPEPEAPTLAPIPTPVQPVEPEKAIEEKAIEEKVKEKDEVPVVQEPQPEPEKPQAPEQRSPMIITPAPQAPKPEPVPEPVIKVKEPVVKVKEPAIEIPKSEIPKPAEPVIPEPESVIQQPVIQEPVIKKPVIKQPVLRKPVIEKPVIENPIIENPVMEEPVIKEPVIKEPVIKEPVIREPVRRSPVQRKPVLEKPKPVIEPEPEIKPEPEPEIQPDSEPARTSEEVRQRAKERMDDVLENLDDTFDQVRERSVKMSQDAQKFWKRFRSDAAKSSTDSSTRQRDFLNQFQQPLENSVDPNAGDLPVEDLVPELERVFDR
jgi:hypothetical protein